MPQKPGMMRDDLLDINTGGQFSPRTLYCV